jgi:hypothetical protein
MLKFKIKQGVRDRTRKAYKEFQSYKFYIVNVISK